jgi:hypothetical protein
VLERGKRYIKKRTNNKVSEKFGKKGGNFWNGKKRGWFFKEK